MKRSFVLIVAILLLFSCDSETFTVRSTSLSLEREYSEGVLESASLSFSSSLSESGEYSLILRSPDSTLEWSSPLIERSGNYVSDQLKLTRGALFPQGDYIWFIMNSESVEHTGTVNLSYDTSPRLPSPENPREGEVVTYFEGSDEYEIFTFDSYANPILVRGTT